MEGVPKIPEENGENPDSLKNKLKKWGKIAAISSLGFMPLKGGDAYTTMTNEEGIKIEREEKIKALLGDIKFTDKSEVKENYEKAYERYDEQHQWLKDIVGSKEYKERMMKELSSNEKSADEYIENRKENLNNRDYDLAYGGVVDEHKNRGVFDSYEKLVTLPTNSTQEYGPIGIHEFTHDMTDGTNGMTKKAIDLYNESFNLEKLKYVDRKQLNYFQNPTERDARKKVFEYELESLGVKKYSEEFTQEHYNRALELMSEGRLSEQSLDFLIATKPEYVLRIMNEIAENKLAQEDNQNLA
jgi:hypothetical protein